LYTICFNFSTNTIWVKKRASAVTVINFDEDSNTFIFSTLINSGFSVTLQLKKQVNIVNKINVFFIYLFLDLMYLHPLKEGVKILYKSE